MSHSPKLTDFPRQHYGQGLVLKLTKTSCLLHCEQSSAVSSGPSLSAFSGAFQHHPGYSIVVQCLKHALFPFSLFFLSKN